MNDDLKKIVGKELMLIRKESNQSIMELSQKTGLATSTISTYENGIRNMNLDNISKIVDNCNADMSIFFEKCYAKLQK